MTESEIDILNQKAWETRYENHEKAMKYATEALKSATKSNYEKGIHFALLYKSIVEILMSKLENVLDNLLITFEYFEETNEKPGLVRSLYGLANLYKIFGDYNKALEYCTEGEKIALVVCPEELGEIYNEKGSVYIGLCDFEHAVEALEKSFENRHENDHKGRASTLNRLGWANVERASIEQNEKQKSSYFSLALNYYRQAIDLRKEINDVQGIPFSYFGLGNLYEVKGEYDKAEKTYLICQDFNNKNSKDTFCALKCDLALGKIDLINKKDTAYDYLIKSKKIADSMSSRYFQCEINKSLSEYYEDKKDYKKAYDHYKVYSRLRREILNTENQNKIKYQQIKIISEKNHELENKNRIIEESVKAAQYIQSAALPQEDELNDLVSDYFILFKPRDIVSGDFYWFKRFGNKIYLAASDCTGHGIPGAFTSMLGMAFLNEIIQDDIKSPNIILNELRSKIKNTLKQTGKEKELKDGMDLALCLLDFNRNTLEYAGAFNPLFLIRNKELIEYKADRMPIAIYPKETEFTNNVIELHKGDTFYIFSDGFPDQLRSEELKKYSTKKFKDFLVSIADMTMNKQKQALEKEHDEWRRNQWQTDDILIVGIRI